MPSHPRSRRRRSDGERTERLNVHIASELVEGLRLLCVHEGRSLSNGVEVAIGRLLKSRERTAAGDQKA